MREPLDLDRLIEEGLALYGRGDLDAALLVWEQVLSVDPTNEQANSYVDYVRMNYEMLTSDTDGEASAPFGIADDNEPEYLIEITDGELPRGTPDNRPTPPMYMDPADEGWFIEDERMRVVPPGSSGSSFDDDARTGDEPLELEMEADEPPPPTPPPPAEDAHDDEIIELGLPDRPKTTIPKRANTANAEVNFDDATHEYEGPRSGGDFATPEPITNEFTPEGTPGFSAQLTDIRKRETGFVKPRSQVTSGPPELKMTLRTPAKPIDYPRSVHEDPTKETLLQDRASAFERSYAEAELDFPAGDHQPLSPMEPDELSLPSPKPAHITRDLPPPSVKPATTPPATKPAKTTPPPARRSALQNAIDSIDLDAPLEEGPNLAAFDAPYELSPPEVSSTAKTRDLPNDLQISFAAPLEPATHTRDFSEKPTLETPRPPQVHPDPVIGAPTRELGLRAHGRASTEDEPTRMNPRIHPKRDRATIQPSVQPDPGGTRADIVLPFDPIDARASQILDEIDDNAPANEEKEDRTRRRISTLLERATQWSQHDLERAVAAVDLALSEDPNSALAQKLIHRNRDVIMGVFQAFLGDLERQPELARPLHELAAAPISPRAAFLLSRVDGTLSLDEILDVSGMPRLEAYRYLCQLFLRGILR